jgi:hypothetical protein
MKDPEGDVYSISNPSLTKEMVRLNPELAKFIQNNRIVWRVARAVYGAKQSARLFYNFLRKALEGLGFRQNAYDECVFYQKSDLGVIIVTIHVDDLFGIASSTKASEEFFSKLNSIFPDGIKLNDGDKLNYLGRELDFSESGVLIVSMPKHTEDCLQGVKGVAKTPADENLFKVDPKSELLTASEKEEFHTHVAKLLYLTIAMRYDLGVSVSFLTSRVQNPTKEDWSKLMRVKKYLNGTKKLKAAA